MDFDKNFKDNIAHDVFDISSRNILNWIKENRDKYDWAKDPNAYEMTNLFLLAAKYKGQGKQIDTSVINEIWEIRKQDFERCNISENNFVYRIVQDSYESAMSGKTLVNDNQSHHALRKMAGIGLYLYQQKRDNKQVSYNNPQELLELLSSAKSLNKLHPELFERYAFLSNINKLCELQLSQKLPQQLKDTIKEAQSEFQLSKKERNKTTNGILQDSHIKSLLERKEQDLLHKLLEYTEGIFEFINIREENMYMVHKSNTPAASYYYSLNFELSHIGLQDSRTKENIGKQIDRICEKYHVNFGDLLSLAEQSRECMDDVHSKQSDRLYDSLQKGAIEYFNDKEKELE